ncbi:hypothetical protein P3X46_028816 [Hevea brasiliensis]|uniref:Uncharacterized protein n=1 Tax=Hevea brasiliensis TaxID=3981 RepID=A0ABQ9KQT7_HEVBR|nr:UPF0481 protein At3g47200 [Hevea brasiliensis]KAJ9146570.1 hypothetical protein P3X46_028816 [Hevea brasiliensis]
MGRSSQVLLDIDELANTIREKLEILHPLSDECCIYRVPDRLRQLNHKAYTPRVLSIGPLHHGGKELQAMEEHKNRYLQDFLRLSGVSLEDCIQIFQQCEIRLRNCYAETIQLSSNDFVKMMLLDASFIIMLFLKHCFGDLRNRIRNDRIYNKPWLILDIRFDLILLENQIPFFILEDLFMLSNIPTRLEGVSIVKLVYEFFRDGWDSWVKADVLERHSSFKIEHILDFLRICQQPSELQPHKELRMLVVPSTTELYQAGVKFQLSSSKNVLDIKFKNGILEIPRFRIVDQTEILLRNLQAFEQCHCLDNYVGDYIAMMAMLVNSANDVELLSQNGIIENWLRSNEALAALFREVEKENIVFPDRYCFSAVIEDLNVHCRAPWHKWKANLKQNYFNTPWVGISVVAAAILLFLTVIQTVCSLLQV